MHKTLYNISRKAGGKCPLSPIPAGAHALNPIIRRPLSNSDSSGGSELGANLQTLSQ